MRVWIAVSMIVATIGLGVLGGEYFQIGIQQAFDPLEEVLPLQRHIEWSRFEIGSLVTPALVAAVGALFLIRRRMLKQE